MGRQQWWKQAAHGVCQRAGVCQLLQLCATCNPACLHSRIYPQTYKKLPEIVRRWQLFREEALRSGDGRQLLLGRPPVGCEVQWIRHEVLQILKVRGWGGSGGGGECEGWAAAGDEGSRGHGSLHWHIQACPAQKSNCAAAAALRTSGCRCFVCLS